MRKLQFAILFVVFALPSIAMAGPKPLELEVDWLGTSYRWEELLPAAPPPATWEALDASAEKDLAGVAGALRNLSRSAGLDDYGTLMLVRAFAMRIPLDAQATPRRLHEAWGKSWDERSRGYFVSAVLNVLGYRAVRFEATGRTLIGLPTVDGELNARTQTLSIERSLLGIKKSLERTYLLWDIQGRLGDPQIGAAAPELKTPLARIFNEEQGTLLDFRRRKIPHELTARKTTAVLQWPGGRAVSYNVVPDVARYLALFPEHHFAAQLRLERDELAMTGLGKAVLAFANVPEDRFVTELLQAVQMTFRYTPGPLRSIHEILYSGEGDCDQLAAVLAQLLLAAGYSDQSLAAVVWQDADHMGLALRPKRRAPPQANKLVLGGADYFVLDPTYYHRRGDEIVTAWGEMNPDNVRRQAVIYQFGSAR